MLRIEFNEVAFTDDFQDLPAESVVEYIQHIIPLNPDTVLKACLNWIIMDVDDRKEHFAAFAEYIDFSLCSPEYLKHVYNTCREFWIAFEHIAGQLSRKVLPDVEPENHVPVKQSVLMCGGSYEIHKMNRFVYEINLFTTNAQKVAELPSLFATTMPALCSTPQGVFGAGGKPTYDGFPEPVGTTGCWLYNKYSWRVKELPSLSVPIFGAGAVCLDNKVYVIGGHPEETDVVNILDLDTYEWSPDPQLLHQVHFPKVAAIGHKIYVLHDNDSYTDLIPLQYLDTRTNNWSNTAPLPAEITHTQESSMVAMGDSLYIQADGWHKYNAISDSRTTLSQTLEEGVSRYSFVSPSPVVVGDKTVVCGGCEPAWIPIYDCLQDEWEAHRSPEIVRNFTMTYSVAL